MRRIYTHHDPIRQRVNIYVQVSEEEDGSRWFQAGGDPSKFHGAGELTRVPQGQEPPLWGWVSDEIAEALGKALAPPPDFGARHLEDAIDVRDRLLVILETQAMSTANAGSGHLAAEAGRRRDERAQR
jgi:hypothetical protein